MTKHFPRLILASRSPRRRELLAAAGYEFEVCPPSESAEGGVCSGETPRELVARLARQKAADVVRRIGRGLVLGCDTVVECNGQILGKPADEAHARAMLAALSGQEHRVLSGVCLMEACGAGVPPAQGEKGTGTICAKHPSGRSGKWCLSPFLSPAQKPCRRDACTTTAADPLMAVAVTTLRMDPLTSEQLDAYIATGQWQGKAGAFGYQDGLDWVHVVEGSESNVVGLPMELLAEMLESLRPEVA